MAFVIDRFEATPGVAAPLMSMKPGDLPVQLPSKFEIDREPQDCQGARSCRTRGDSAARRRGDRITAGYVGYGTELAKPALRPLARLRI